MIFFSEKPNGGFGNRLFHYNFALQIADVFEIELATEIGKDSDYINILHNDSSNISWKGTDRYTWKDLKDYSRQEVYMAFLQTLKAKRKIELKGPYLGDTFFDYTKRSPKDLIQKKALKLAKKSISDIKRCVIHVRGGDFHTWNPLAIQSIEYYIQSINKVLEESADVNFEVVTDDPNMSLVNSILTYLKANCNYVTSTTSDFLSDFHKLSTCHYQISSPSTFAIWGAILSEVDVKVIHSKKWVDYCINNGEKFWMEVNDGGNDYYKIWDLIDG